MTIRKLMIATAAIAVFTVSANAQNRAQQMRSDATNSSIYYVDPTTREALNTCYGC